VISLAPWTPIDWTTVPKALSDDKVTVQYLLSPLLEEDFGDTLEYFNLYHGAIAFTNNRTGYEITINYDAFDLFRSSLFPKIIVFPNGTRELSWVNEGGAFIYLGINETYWTAGQYAVSVINGDLFNDYIVNYISSVNASYPYYNMFAVLDQFGVKPYLPSWDCFDFVWASMAYLYASGAKFDYSYQVKRNFANIYSAEPIDYTDLYESDPVVKNSIIDFYEFIDASFGDLSWIEFFDALSELFEGEFYVRSSTKYWKADLHYPYMAVDFVGQPLPGQNFTKSY